MPAAAKDIDMPYVKQELRQRVDSTLDELVQRGLLHTNSQRERKGLANYLVTRLVLRLLKPNDGWNYASLADVDDTLDCANKEIYRRLIAPYEDEAIKKNGDLSEFGV